MLRLVIIADDLTGTLDCAAPFADAGLRVRVATHPAAVAAALNGADVLAVSTNSREMAPMAAAATVAGVLAAVPAGVRLFKKVDSRLKGNIAAELAVMPSGPVLAIPAIPEFGRIVRDGAVCGFGVGDPIAVAEVLDAGDRVVLVPDTATSADMTREVQLAPPDMLIVGARGAAMALAPLLSKGPSASAAASLPLPMVIVVGSTDPITLEQVAHLCAARADLCWIAAPDGCVPDNLPRASLMLVQATQGAGASGSDVAAALACGIVPLLGDAGTLVLTGGATADAVLGALGIDVLVLAGDILPGLPLSYAAGLAIVTKSGGFGGARTLVSLVEKTVLV